VDNPELAEIVRILPICTACQAVQIAAKPAWTSPGVLTAW
jgi:hypothetical protein